MTDKNSDGQLTAAQETARAVAHGVIAAATAAAGGNNALTAAISAGGSEAAAPYVSQWLYGEKDGSKLTAEQKQTVSSILSLGGVAVGAAATGSAEDMVTSGQAAQTAVENNFEAILTPQGRNYLSNVSSLAQSSLAHHNGDIASMMKDIDDYSSCKGCKNDGHRYVEFILDGSSQVAMTVVTGGVVNVIRGAKAAHYLNTLRKVTQNEKAVTFAINGTANATISAIADKENRKPGSAVYNFVVGGTAGAVATRMPGIKTNALGQGTVYGSGELAKHTLYGDGEAVPKTSDVLQKTGAAFIGGAAGAGVGNIVSKSIPSSNTNTAIDALSGSITSSLYGYTIEKMTNKKEKDKK